jgi:hypothetical protein
VPKRCQTVVLRAGVIGTVNGYTTGTQHTCTPLCLPVAVAPAAKWPACFAQLPLRADHVHVYVLGTLKQVAGGFRAVVTRLNADTTAR